MALATALLALVGTAGAQEPVPVEAPWYVGLPVADVRLLSPEGGLPEESLEPLLRAGQGEPLDVQDIRLDLVTLFRVGEFSGVEADLEPWVVYDDQGNLGSGVLLTYVVHPAPRVSEVKIEGNEWLRDRTIRDAVRVGVGQVFYPELDAAGVRQRVVALLRELGFPDASVEVITMRREEAEVGVRVVIDEGEPRLVSRIAFAGEVPVDERKLRRWVRRAGVKTGEPLSTDAVKRAQFRVRDELGSWGGLFTARRGWVEARVTPAITGDGEGGTLVTFTIEPGPRLLLEVDGLTWRPKAKVREGMEIDERVRLTRGFLEAAPERMETWLQRRGYWAAQVEVSLEEDPSRRFQVLDVDIDRSRRHVLHRIEFEGNRHIAAEELRTVMDQASDEVLRLNRATRPELQQAVGAIEDVYRSRGYLDVDASLVEIRITDKLAELAESGRPPLGRSLTRPFNPRVRWLVPRIEIDEGPVTTLTSLEVQGAAEHAGLGFVDTRREELVGAPFSPQALESLARRITDAHRAAGYLEADTRVFREPGGEQQMAASLVVESGPRVRLRSVVTRGAQVTRPGLIGREVAMDLGQPVTSQDLEELRRNLYGLGIFRTVQTSLLGDEEARDLVIQVQERPLWAFELGGGIATDQGIRGFGRITRRNLWGRAHRLELYGLLGFDWLGSSITDWTPDITDPEWRAAITYTAPHFPIRSQEVVIDLLLRERRLERTWQMSRSGLGLALETRLGEPTTLHTGVRAESRRLEEVDPGALLPGEPWTELIDVADPELPSSARMQGNVFALLLHDRRDNPLAPSRGFLVSVLGEWAPGFELGRVKPVPFVKTEVRASGYLPLGGPLIRLAGEGARATTVGDGVVALEDRYRLGGTGSLRGFRRDGVGPRNQVDAFTMDWPDQLGPAIAHATREDPSRWVETGGDTMALGIAELILPLPVLGLRAWEGYAASLFADVGNVWLTTPGARDLASSEQEPWTDIYDPVLRYGVGVGLRVSTPVGPLQADFAVNPDAIRASGAAKDLLRDEWKEPVARFHLSLGAL